MYDYLERVPINEIDIKSILDNETNSVIAQAHIFDRLMNRMLVAECNDETGEADIVALLKLICFLEPHPVSTRKVIFLHFAA